MAGYSGTPLSTKLGIKVESKVMLLNAPKNYMDFVGADISKQLINEISKAYLMHLFVVSKAELKKDFLRIIQRAKDDLIIWIS